MSIRNRLLVALALVLALAACKDEKAKEEESFSFVVYPGSRYLPQVTDLMKQASALDPPKFRAFAAAQAAAAAPQYPRCGK